MSLKSTGSICDCYKEIPRTWMAWKRWAKKSRIRLSRLNKTYRQERPSNIALFIVS
jgi:hypothetical protein